MRDPKLVPVAQAEPVDTVLLTAGGNDLCFKHKLLTIGRAAHREAVRLSQQRIAVLGARTG